MARVTYGPLITDIAGSIGNLTFQNNPSGSIMRSRPEAVTGSTRYQRYTQQVLQGVNTLWLNLAQSYKDLWNAHALATTYINFWNESKKLSGFQWFISVNTNLTQCYRATLTQPAAYTPPANFPVYTLSFTAGDLIANFSGTEDMRLYDIIWYATPPIKTSSINDRSKYIRLITIGNFNANHQHLNQYYQNTFGINLANLSGVANCNVTVYARRILISTGYSSPMRVVSRKII